MSEDRNLLKELSRAGSEFFSDWFNLDQQKKQSAEKKKMLAQQQGLEWQKFLMNYFAKNRQFRDQQKLKKEALKQNENLARQKLEKQVSDQLFARDIKKTTKQPQIPLNFDDRFDLYLQGQYQPTPMEEPIFQAKIKKMLGEGDEKPAKQPPNMVEKTINKFGDIQRINSRALETNYMNPNDTTDQIPPFYNIKHLGQAYNYAYRHQILQDRRFGKTLKDRQRAADSIYALITGEQFPPPDTLGVDTLGEGEINPYDYMQAGEVPGLLRSTGEPLQPQQEQVFQPEQTVPQDQTEQPAQVEYDLPTKKKLLDLLLKWKADPESLTEEEHRQINELIFKGK